MLASTEPSWSEYREKGAILKNLNLLVLAVCAGSLTGCTFTPTEVEPINGIPTFSVTSNRVANQNAGNPDTVAQALRELEQEAVPLYMKEVCGNRGHRIVLRSEPTIEPWTGRGGGWFVKRTFLAQCR